MAAYKLIVERISQGQTDKTGAIDNDAATTAALVNDALTRNPDRVETNIVEASEAQIRGILQYANRIHAGSTTTTVETDIAALF